MKIEVKITDDDGNVQQYDVSDSPHFHCILNEHYDDKGRLDGGIIIDKGVVRGHIDPKGEEGCPGIVGITDYDYNGILELEKEQVKQRSEQLIGFLKDYQKSCELMHVSKIDAKNFVDHWNPIN